MRGVRVAVIGAGVSGLTAATELISRGANVEIWARERHPRTTSDVAAAFWHPFLVEDTPRVERWAMVAYRRFAEIASRHPESGVRMLPVTELFGDTVAPPAWLERLQGHQVLSPSSLPRARTVGRGFVAPVIETNRYLPWLERRLLRAGCILRQRHVEDVDAVFDSASYVVNATGIGATTLIDDDSLRPMRGQVVRLKGASRGTQPRVLLDSADPEGALYIVPRSEDVVIGASADPSSDTSVRESETASLLRRARELSPSLSTAAVANVAVGIRPWRPTVRLEHEERPRGSLFHCYGHGGAGVTLSWGCAGALVDLVSTVTALTGPRGHEQPVSEAPLQRQPERAPGGA
jgi:D-amino-acid oxidase